MSNYTEIEKKAITQLRFYVEDSPMIVPYVREDDKEPIWDGYLYLYTDSAKDKEHFFDKVAVQIKGKTVDYIKIDNFKYAIDTRDLRAYLNEPVVYVVCQIVKGTKERKLFYRCLLPETIKNILKGKDKQDTVSVKMKPFPEECSDFENILTTFVSDRRKQFQYAHSSSISIEEVKKRGIAQFQLSTPAKPMSRIETLQYLSSHESFLYANLDSQYNITIPVDLGGEYSISFGIAKDVEIKVGDRVFFNSVNSKIENGIIKVNVEDALTFEMEDVSEILHTKTIQVHVKSDQLDKRIKEYEFILALYRHQIISIGDKGFEVDVEGLGDISEIEKQYAYWKEVQSLLKKMHVTKPLLISTLQTEHYHHLELLKEGILRGNLLNTTSLDNELHILSIGNLRLLIWSCKKENKNKCSIGDFFDGTIELGFKRDDEMLIASPFSYLRNDLWHKIDNIPFEYMIDSINNVAAKHKYVLELVVFDLLAMLTAADKIKQDDESRYEELIRWAQELNQWLISRATNKNDDILCRLNQLQIYKRQRSLEMQEIKWLKSLLSYNKLENYIKLGVSALLEDKDLFLFYKKQISSEDFKNLQTQPISKFFLE